MAPQMTMTRAEQLEFSRAAQALYRRGANDLGHLLSGVAASAKVDSDRYDRAAAAYRAWLMFDEPRQNEQEG